MGFSRQEYWSGVSLPSPGKPQICTHLPISGITTEEASEGGKLSFFLRAREKEENQDRIQGAKSWGRGEGMLILYYDTVLVDTIPEEGGT